MKGTSAFLSLLALVLLLQGCSGGITLIHKSENLRNTLSRKDRIVMVEPEMLMYTAYQDVKVDLIQGDQFKNRYLKSMRKMALKNDIEIDIRSVNTGQAQDAEYFNDLLRIRQEIISANSTQAFPSNNSFRSMAGVQQNVFTTPLVLKPEMARYAKQYGTRFFGTSGFVSDGSSTYSYMIIVDVLEGEVVYREIKQIPKKITREVFNYTLYNSFFLLKQNIRG